MAYLAESNRLIVTDGGDSDAVELVIVKTTKSLALSSWVKAWTTACTTL